MDRASEAVVRWGFALVAIGAAIAGCEAALDVSRLTERGLADGGGEPDSTSGGVNPGSGSGTGSGAASGFGSGSSSGSTSGSTEGGSGSTSGAEAGSSGSLDGSSGVIEVDAGPATSCTGAGASLTHCGQRSPSIGESCCTSFEVPGGSFDRSYTTDGGVLTSESAPATVSGFRLDKYLVTVGRFRQFVVALSGGATTGYTNGAPGAYVVPAGSGKHTHLNGGNGLAAVGGSGPFEPGWVAADDTNIAPADVNLACSGNATWTDAPGSNEYRAINCVTWAEAYAFCIWDGGFLPSEAEWEYAAAGGNQQREYPWGADDPSASASYAVWSCNYPNPTQASCMNSGVNVPPVGIVPQGAARWGQLDMAGNMDEWALDWYSSGYVAACTDCTNVGTSADGRVVRGGSFRALFAANLLSASRTPSTQDERSEENGFRCARTP